MKSLKRTNAIIAGSPQGSRNMDQIEIDFQSKCSEFVAANVYGRVSMLVHDLASQYGGDVPKDLEDYVETAFELCQPELTDEHRLEAMKEENYTVFEVLEDHKLGDIPWLKDDLEDEDIDNDDIEMPDVGFYVIETIMDSVDLTDGPFDSVAEAIEDFVSTSYGRDVEDRARECAGEIFEHWVVSDHFAYWLKQKGEKIGELDGLTIWGRTTTGQSISIDYVVREIVREMGS